MIHFESSSYGRMQEWQFIHITKEKALIQEFICWFQSLLAISKDDSSQAQFTLEVIITSLPSVAIGH